MVHPADIHNIEERSGAGGKGEGKPGRLRLGRAALARQDGGLGIDKIR